MGIRTSVGGRCGSPGEKGQKPRLGWTASLISCEGNKAVPTPLSE